MALTSVRLQEDLEPLLDEEAAKLKRSKSWLINQAVREFFERRKDAAQRWQETLSALDSVRAGRVVAGDEVHAWLDSWGQAGEKTAPK